MHDHRFALQAVRAFEGSEGIGNGLLTRFVGDHGDQRRTVTHFALDQALDRKPGVAHRGGDFGKHTRPVGNEHAQIGFVDPVGSGGARQFFKFGGRNRESRASFLARDIDKIGNHRRCGGTIARARSLKQQAAREIAFRNNSICRAGYIGEWVVDRYKAWLHALIQRRASIFAIDFGKADQADAISQRLRLRDVSSDDLANAANIDTVKIDAAAKAERGEDRKLVRGIDTINVEAGIGLGKSPWTCASESTSAKSRTIAFHRR